jgi:hypothetical protein
MFLFDSLLVGGLRFVLDSLATAVDAELHDDSALRERLLEAGLKLELGELSPEEFAEIEHDVLRRLRALRNGEEGMSLIDDDVTVVGVEATVAKDLAD